jgi:hypothetical protein
VVRLLHGTESFYAGLEGSYAFGSVDSLETTDGQTSESQGVDRLLVGVRTLWSSPEKGGAGPYLRGGFAYADYGLVEGNGFYLGAGWNFSFFSGVPGLGLGPVVTYIDVGDAEEALGGIALSASF